VGAVKPSAAAFSFGRPPALQPQAGHTLRRSSAAQQQSAVSPIASALADGFGRQVLSSRRSAAGYSISTGPRRGGGAAARDREDSPAPGDYQSVLPGSIATAGRTHVSSISPFKNSPQASFGTARPHQARRGATLSQLEQHSREAAIEAKLVSAALRRSARSRPEGGGTTGLGRGFGSSPREVGRASKQKQVRTQSCRCTHSVYCIFYVCMISIIAGLIFSWARRIQLAQRHGGWFWSRKPLFNKHQQRPKYGGEGWLHGGQIC